MILVKGTPDSGKSVKAEALAVELSPDGKRIYLATMIPFGEEGAMRVEKHRALRKGKGFVTVERAFDVGNIPDDRGCIAGIRAKEATVLIECVSNLCANVMFEKEKGRKLKSPEEVSRIVTKDIMNLKDKVKNLIAVTNDFILEEGFDEETLLYIRAMEYVNRELKDRADVTVLKECH